MDLVLSHQAGIKITVAVSGTALADTLTTKENVVNNLGIVRRLSQNIILAFDSDAAGRKAAMRSAQIALSLGMDVKIAPMPEGKDPADMVLNDPESWKNVLRGAKPVVEFQLNSVMEEAKEKKLDSRKIPLLLREKVLPFITALDGAMEKSHFIKMIHEKTGLSEDSIREDIKKLEKDMAIKLGPLGAAMSGQRQGSSGTILRNAESAQVTRLDMISRKLFGLLAYLDREKIQLDTDDIRVAIKKIAGELRFNNLIKDSEPLKNELILEAEIENTRDPAKLKTHIDELLLNFEEDILRQEFVLAMAELGKVETKERGDELAKQCSILAKRIDEISKKRNL